MTPPAGGPVFVVGPMGSGTTLMRLVLDSHENLAIAPETGFARLLLAHEHIPFWKFGGEWYGRLGMTRDDLDAELRAFYGGIYSRFAAQHGATRWGDKTPFHTWHMPRLARVFPDSVFVGTARHPGAVAASLVERFGFTWQSGIRHWLRSTTEMVHRGARLGDRFVLCRYEELVTEPEPVLRELIGWLGEPWSDAVLAFHEVQRDRGTAAVVEGRTRSDRPLDPGRVGRWTTAMDDGGRRLLRRDAAALAGLLGYDVDDPMPVRPLAGEHHDGQHLATGSDLAVLVSRDTGVDWTRRPRPTLENRRMRTEDIRRLRRLAAAGAGRAGPEPVAGQMAGPVAGQMDAQMDAQMGGRRRGRVRRAARRLPSPVRERLREVVAAVRRRGA